MSEINFFHLVEKFLLNYEFTKNLESREVKRMYNSYVYSMIKTKKFEICEKNVVYVKRTIVKTLETLLVS